MYFIPKQAYSSAKCTSKSGGVCHDFTCYVECMFSNNPMIYSIIILCLLLFSQGYTLDGSILYLTRIIWPSELRLLYLYYSMLLITCSRHLREHCKDMNPNPNLDLLSTFKDWQLITPINIALMITPICLMCPLQLVHNIIGHALLLRVIIFSNTSNILCLHYCRFSKVWVMQAVLTSLVTLRVKYGWRWYT